VSFEFWSFKLGAVLFSCLIELVDYRLTAATAEDGWARGAFKHQVEGKAGDVACVVCRWLQERAAMKKEGDARSVRSACSWSQEGTTLFPNPSSDATFFTTTTAS